MKLGDIVKTIQRDDLGPGAPQDEWVDRILTAFNRNAEQLQQVLNSLSLTDNFQCDIVTGRFTHGVPVVFPLKKLTVARSALILQGAGQGALFAAVDSAGRDATSGKYLARVTVWFANSAQSKNIKATVLLLPEGPDSGTASLGGGFDAGNLADGAVTTPKIADDAVTTIKIVDTAIISAKLADLAVNSAKLADLAVVAAKLSDGAVTTQKLNDLAVTTAKITDNAINAAKILDGVVGTLKLTDAAVTSLKLNDLAVTTQKLADLSVATGKLADLAVSTGKLVDSAVSSVKLADASVASAKLIDGSVITAKLAAAGVTADKLGASLPGDNLLKLSGFRTSSGGVAEKYAIYNNTPGPEPVTPSIVAGFSGVNKAQRLDWAVNNTSTKGILTDAGAGGALAENYKANQWYVVSFKARAGGTVLGVTMTLAWNHAPFDQLFIVNPQLTGSAQRYAFKIRYTAVPTASELFITIQPNTTCNGFLEIGDVSITEGDVLDAYAPRVSELIPGAVGTTELAVDAVTTAKLAAGAVTAAKIAAATITANEIAAGAITTSQLAALAVTAAKIAANTITAGNIAAGTITAAEIAALTITAAKIAAGTIDASKLVAHTITANEIAALTITAAEIAAGTITAAKIAAGTITANELAAGSVIASKIGAGEVVAGKIAAGAIGTNELAAGAVVASKIGAGEIIAGKIAAGAVGTNELAAQSVTAAKIATLTITANELAANAVVAGKIAAGAITADKITAGEITADKVTAPPVDNLWPNATSERDPPATADLTKPEWAGRLNAGAGAFAGSWVRQLSAALNGQQLLGDTFGAGTRPATESALAFMIPCAPGDSFYIEGRAKWITVTGAQACGVDMHFLDAAGAQVATASASTPNTGGTAAGWVKVSAAGTAPAGAVWVRFFCSMNSTLGAATAQYDAIYARRSINGPVLGDGTAWFAKSWVAGGRLQWNHTAPGTNAFSWSAIINGVGQTFLRFDYDAPPASIGTGVTPIAFAQLKGVAGSHVHNGWEARVHTIDTTLRQVSFDLYDSAGTLVDLNTVSFVVHINLFLFFPVLSGYTL